MMVFFECVINGHCKKIQRMCNFYGEYKQKKVVLTSAHVPIFPVHELGSYIIKNKKNMVQKQRGSAEMTLVYSVTFSNCFAWFRS